MQLNKLHIFKVIYACGTTAEAADRLKVTRSAVSQSLSKLEQELGVALFTRLPKGLIPTPQGHRLAASITPLLDRLDAEVEALSQDRHGISGVLHVGAPLMSGTVHMPRILELYRQAQPHAEVHLTLEFSSRLLDKVLKGQLDLALIDVFGGVDLHRDLQVYCHQETVIEEVVSMVCSPQYYDQHIQGDHSFERLSQLDYLALAPEALEVKSWFQTQFGKAPRHLKKRLIVDNGLALLEMAKLHGGVNVTGSNVSHEAVTQGSLVEVCPVHHGEKNSISLIQLLDKKPGRLEKAFIEVLHHYAQHHWESGL